MLLSVAPAISLVLCVGIKAMLAGSLDGWREGSMIGSSVDVIKVNSMLRRFGCDIVTQTSQVNGAVILSGVRCRNFYPANAIIS
jgi:hypothetical protein